jgi:hypothetical protein
MVAFSFHDTAGIGGRLGAPATPVLRWRAGAADATFHAMMLRFPRAFLFIGWLLTIGGVLYVALGLRGMRTGETGLTPLLLIGLVAVVVGTSVIRWVRRER